MTLPNTGAYSDGCALVEEERAEIIGWVLTAAGIAGLAVLVIVTLFSVHAHNLERLRMWKYALAGLVLIVLSALAHDLLYLLDEPAIGIWYGAVGLIPVVVGYAVLYWYIRDVHFFGDVQSRDALKALKDSDEVANVAMQHDALDGFETHNRLVVFVVTALLYNILAVVLVWLVAALASHALFWSLLSLALFSAAFLVIVVILAYATSIYGAQPVATYKRV